MKKMKAGIILLLGLFLSACATKDLDIKRCYTVELGESISTNAKKYLSQDTEKHVLKNTTIRFESNKQYKVDEKKKILIPTDGKYLPVGKYQAYAQYKDKQKAFYVEVKDTKAPKFIDFQKEIKIEQGSTKDLSSYFYAEDLSKVEIRIDGKVDFNKLGIYKVKVSAIDSYKNKSTKTAEIKIISKEEASNGEASSPKDSPSNSQVTNGTSGNSHVSPNNNTGNGNSGNNGGNTTPPSNVCVPDGTYLDLGNTGKWWTSEAAMDAEIQAGWFDENSPYYGKGYNAWTIRDSCGNERNDLWTADLY